MSSPVPPAKAPMDSNQLFDIVAKFSKEKVEPKPTIVAQLRRMLAANRPLVEQQCRETGAPNPYLNLPPLYDPSIPLPVEVERLAAGGVQSTSLGSNGTAGRAQIQQQAQGAGGPTAAALRPPPVKRSDTANSIQSTATSSPVKSHKSPTPTPTSTISSPNLSAVPNRTANPQDQRTEALLLAKNKATKVFCFTPVPRAQPPPPPPGSAGNELQLQPPTVLPPQLTGLSCWADVFVLPNQVRAVYFKLTPPGTEQTFRNVLAVLDAAKQSPVTLVNQLRSMRANALAAKGTAGGVGGGAGGTAGNAAVVGSVGGGAGPLVNAGPMRIQSQLRGKVADENEVGTLDSKSLRSPPEANSSGNSAFGGVTPVQAAADSAMDGVESKPSTTRSGTASGHLGSIPPAARDTVIQPTNGPLPNLTLPTNAARGAHPAATVRPTNRISPATFRPVPTSTAQPTGTLASRLTQQDVDRFKVMTEEQVRSLSQEDLQKCSMVRRMIAQAAVETSRKASLAAAAAANNSNVGGASSNRLTVGPGGSGFASGPTTPHGMGPSASIDLTQDVKPVAPNVPILQAGMVRPGANTAGPRPPPQTPSSINKSNINERVRAILAAEGGISAERVRSLYLDSGITITQIVEESIHKFIASTINKGTNNTRPPTPPPPPISARDLAHTRMSTMLMADNDGVPVSEDVSNRLEQQFFTDLAEDLFTDQILGGSAVHSSLHGIYETSTQLQMKDIALYGQHVYGRVRTDFGLESGFGILDTFKKRKGEPLAPVRAKRMLAIKAARLKGNGGG